MMENTNRGDIVSTAFRGSTEKCLAHLTGELGGNKAAVCKYLSEFTNVNILTPKRWMTGIMPVGVQLIQLRFYLELCGYEVTELKNLNEKVRDAARILAFNVISISEMAQMLGYSGRNGIDALLATLRGMRGVTKARLKDFQALIDMYQAQLPEKITAARSCQMIGAATVIVNTQEEDRRPVLEKTMSRFRPRKPLSMNETVVQALSKSVLAMIPLAEAIGSDNFSAEDRAQLRKITEDDGVFKLANLLYRLCGERSRRMHSTDTITKEVSNG